MSDSDDSYGPPLPPGTENQSFKDQYYDSLNTEAKIISVSQEAKSLK